MDGDGRYLWMGMGGTCGWGCGGSGGAPVYGVHLGMGCQWMRTGEAPVDGDLGRLWMWMGEGRGAPVDGEAGRGRPGVTRDG